MMNSKKFFVFAVIALLLSMATTSCSDDEPDVDAAGIVGTWQCVDAEVTDIKMDYDGISLPDYVLNMLKDRVVESLEGATIVIDSSKVQVKGNVVIFKDSGIEWHIDSMTDNELKVTYETANSMETVQLTMTVKAHYKRIK